MGSRVLVAACAVATLSPSARADVPRTGGRVARVDRDTRRSFGEPRLCELSLESGMASGTCIARTLAIGDTITVFRDHEHHAQLRITAVAQDPSLACGTARLAASVASPTGAGPEHASHAWLVEAAWIDAPPAALDSAQVPAVVDGGVDAPGAAQLVLEASPSGRATDLEFFGFDIDGDGEPDLAFARYECDYRGKPKPRRRPGYGVAAQCYDVWTSPNRGDGLELARTDVVPRC